MLELISRLARLFWEALDRVDYAITLARCWAVDRICGPEPPTSADRQREADHERLRKAFPVADVDGTTAAGKERHALCEPPLPPPKPHSASCAGEPVRNLNNLPFVRPRSRPIIQACHTFGTVRGSEPGDIGWLLADASQVLVAQAQQALPQRIRARRARRTPGSRGCRLIGGNADDDKP